MVHFVGAAAARPTSSLVRERGCTRKEDVILYAGSCKPATAAYARRAASLHDCAYYPGQVLSHCRGRGRGRHRAIADREPAFTARWESSLTRWTLSPWSMTSRRGSAPFCGAAASLRRNTPCRRCPRR
jgi:hypothetical protein